MSAPRHPSRRTRRGALLFEIMLSLALFVAAATVTLGVTRSVFGRLDRAQRRDDAVDLARSRMAELEAGLISVTDLRGEVDGVGSFVGVDDDEPQADDAGQWEIDAKVRRTEYAGLSLIELTVQEIVPQGVDPAEAQAVSFTLRQLVRLRDEEDVEYEVDELLEGLPLGEEEAP